MKAKEYVKETIEGLISRAKKLFEPRFEWNEAMALKLFKARDKALRQQLDRLGVRSDDTQDQAVVKRRMALAGITLKNITHHDDPKSNGIVIFKHGRAVIALSQPFLEKGNIKVQIHNPSYFLGV